MPAPVPPFKRLLEDISKDPVTGCWVWQGHKQPNGYGSIKVFGRMLRAHRYSWELHNGPIEIGLEVLHQCDRKDCVNPEHLRLGTHQENMAEAKERGLMRKGVNHPAFGKENPRKGINSKQARPVWALGRVYESINEAERSLHVGNGTVRWWINNKPNKAKFISREEYKANAE